MCKSLVKIGRAGKYISIDNGPKADNEPNMMAVRNRRDCEIVGEELVKSFLLLFIWIIQFSSAVIIDADVQKIKSVYTQYPFH